jgi:hypothetical protein
MGSAMFQKVILGVALVVGLASAASVAPHAGNHLDASLTRASDAPKTGTDVSGSAAYVVAGSMLMSLGLLFTHIRNAR